MIDELWRDAELRERGMGLRSCEGAVVVADAVGDLRTGTGR